VARPPGRSPRSLMVDLFAGADPDRLRAHPNAKWTRYAADVIPAWIAEMDAPTCPAAIGAVEQLLAGGSVGYVADSVPAALVDAFAGRMESRFGWRPDAASARPISGVTAAFGLVLERLTDPGDDVILQG